MLAGACFSVNVNWQEYLQEWEGELHFCVINSVSGLIDIHDKDFMILFKYVQTTLNIFGVELWVREWSRLSFSWKVKDLFRALLLLCIWSAWAGDFTQSYFLYLPMRGQQCVLLQSIKTLINKKIHQEILLVENLHQIHISPFFNHFIVHEVVPHMGNGGTNLSWPEKWDLVGLIKIE